MTDGAPDLAISGTAYLRLVALGAAIGAPAALLAAVFLAAVHQLEHLLWTDLPDALGHSSPPWYLVVGLPVAGAIVVVAARALLPGDGGHSPLAGIGGGVTPLSHAPGVALAALGTLSFGAVLGPEAPLIALGSVVGLAVTLVVRLGEKEERVLATAGSFSAISALFGGPLVASMLLLEGSVGLGAAAVPALLPGLVAAGVGYTIFIGLGNWSGIAEATISVPGLPVYDGTGVRDLLLGLGAGVVAALLMAVVREVAGGVVAGPGRKLSMPVLLLAGGLAVGLLAQLADVLGADSQDVLFSGQASLPALVAEGSAGTVLVLIACKGIAYAVSLSCGFRGGPVFPAVFLGVGIAMLAILAFDASPTLAVAIGTAAGTAAATRLLFSAALFGALLVGTAGVDALPAAILAAAGAWVTTAALDRREAARAAGETAPAR